MSRFTVLIPVLIILVSAGIALACTTTTTTPTPVPSPTISSTNTLASTQTQAPHPTATATPAPTLTPSATDTALDVDLNIDSPWRDVIVGLSDEELECLRTKVGSELFEDTLNLTFQEVLTERNEVYTEMFGCMPRDTAIETIIDSNYAWLYPDPNDDAKQCARKAFNDIDIVKYMAGAASLFDAEYDARLAYLIVHDRIEPCQYVTSYDFTEVAPYSEVLWHHPDNLAIPRLILDGTVYVESAEGDLYALDAATGTIKWSQDIDGDEDPVIAIKLTSSDGVLYALTHFDNLYAIDMESGALLWDYSSYEEIDFTPVVYDGVVYFWEDHTVLHAIDASTGESLWQYDSHCWQSQSPAVQDGMIYTDFCDEELYVIDASNGKPVPYIDKPVWKHETTYMNSNSRTSLLTDGLRYSLYRDEIFAYNQITGEEIWGYEIDYHSFQLAQIVDGIIYQWSQGDAPVYALSASNGELVWEYQTSAWNSELAVVNGIAYLTTQDGRIHALQGTTGELLWEFSTLSLGELNSSQITPIVSDGVVYIASNHSRLYALDALNGELLWYSLLRGTVIDDIIVADGVVYTAQYEGVYAFKGP